MSHSKKVVVVTGASQGLGAGIVEGFRKLGYQVVATSRSIKPSSDPDILTVAGDIADPATAEKIIREGVARFGRIDTLVNNAGIFLAKPFTAYTREDYVNTVATNMGSFFHMSQQAIAQMEKQGEGGHVVSITTTLVDHAIDGVPSVLASLTKGGMNAATKSLAIEYAKRGIRVNAVSPGIIKTPMHGEESHAALGNLHPVGHMGEVQDIVGAVLYLDSANFVTGEILHVDGGQSAGHRWRRPVPVRGQPRNAPLAGTSRGIVLQVKAMDDLTAVIGIIVRLETQCLGQVAHRRIVGGIHRIHLPKTVSAGGLDQMLHQ